MRQFPTADFKDGPDALQGGTEMPVTMFPYERKERKQEMARLAKESYRFEL